MTYTGGCHCGGVRYEVTGLLRDVIECHCERCRRITGYVMAATGCSTSDLTLTSETTLRWYEPAAGIAYGFCSTCGSTLFWQSDGETNWTSIAAGTLDQPTGLTTTTAWWVAERADYVVATPGLREFEYDGR